MWFSDSLFVMPEIETDRLLLRRLCIRDAQAMYEYTCHEAVARHVLWEAHRSISDTRNYIRYMMRKYRLGDPASWGIEYKPTGAIIGTIGYMWHNPDHASVEVGYSLNDAYWNLGIMTEALSAVIRYSFTKMHINRIEAQHETSNPASGRVMQKCGMRHEGTLRSRLRNKGNYVDVELYAILRSDYLNGE
ncbi:MAG: GNAT family N-acetyltransferase [Clostridia bacterium]|nr:GNAT family N-acetyltransferase [Clostridia bacterium]